MSPEAAHYLNVAKEHLDDAEFALEFRGRPQFTTRSAYNAVLAAARAVIFSGTGKIAKTHGGTRSEIARLAHLDSRIDRTFSTILGSGFDMKSWADYRDGPRQRITADDAAQICTEARRLIAHAEWLLAQPDPPPAA